MPTNEELMARNAILDGIALRYPQNDAGNTQIRYNRIIDALAEQSGWDDTAVRNYVKFQIIKSGKRGGGNLEAYFIGGKLLRYITVEWLDAHVDNLTEIHVKFYLVEGEGQGHGAFVDAIWNARTGKFAGAFYDGKGQRGRSEPGYRAVALSRQGADTHVTVKRYRGERTHVEGHVKGSALRGIVAEQRDRQAREYSRGTSGAVFPEVQYQAARRTSRRFLRAIRSRGIALTEFFEGVSYVSWEQPIHEKAYDLLDGEEERQAAAFGEFPGFVGRADKQLNLFGDEENGD